MRMRIDREKKVKEIEHFLAEKIQPILEEDEKCREYLRAKELYLATFNYGWPYFFSREKAEAFAMKHRGLRVKDEVHKVSIFRKEMLEQEKVALENTYYVEDCKLKLEQIERKIDSISKKMKGSFAGAKTKEKLSSQLLELQHRRDGYKKVVDADAEIEEHYKENPAYLGESFFKLYEAQAQAVRRVLSENLSSKEVAYLIEDVFDKYKTLEEDVPLYKTALFAMKSEISRMKTYKNSNELIEELRKNSLTGRAENKSEVESNQEGENQEEIEKE